MSVYKYLIKLQIYMKWIDIMDVKSSDQGMEGSRTNLLNLN